MIRQAIAAMTIITGVGMILGCHRATDSRPGAHAMGSTTAACDQLAAPKNVAAKRRGDCQHLTISWEAVPDAQRYLVYRSADGTPPADPFTTTAQTACQDSPPRCQEYFYWAKAAADGKTTSDLSNKASGTVECPLEAPADFTVTAHSCQPFTLSWKAVRDATRYVVETDITAAFQHPTVACTTTQTTCSYKTILPQMIYFRVHAENACGEHSTYSTDSKEYKCP